MITFVINVILSLIMTWFVFELYPIQVSAFSSLFIFLASYIVFWSLSFFYNRIYFYKIPKIAAFILYYFKELIVASIKIAHEIITPKDYMEPGIIALPLDVKTDLEITLLANFITLTPGTLSIDVSEDKKTLYIHEMYIEYGDLEKRKQEIKNKFEKRIININITK